MKIETYNKIENRKIPRYQKEQLFKVLNKKIITINNIRKDADDNQDDYKLLKLTNLLGELIEEMIED